MDEGGGGVVSYNTDTPRGVIDVDDKEPDGQYDVVVSSNDVDGAGINHGSRSREAVTSEKEVGGLLDAKCTFGKGGLCEQHLVQGTKLTIPVKKWRDRGGGKGFGWVTTRVTRFQCKVKKTGAEVPENATNVEYLRSQRLRDYYNDVGADVQGTIIQTGLERESCGRLISE